ncbi:MAG TPA: uroporphyrinogen-III synthase [Myxococcales bacterium]|jgi:uroporphyrinogen-III synthase
MTPARVALFESRLSTEIEALVRRAGMEPVCVPAVREERRPPGSELSSLVAAVAGEAAPVFVFLTGVGVAALFDAARAAGCEAELRASIGRSVSVCRGPKPVAALHKEGIAASVKARSPFTTADLVEALAPLELQRRLVVLLHYGERNEPLVSALEKRGARLRELVLYEWELPDDIAAVERIVVDLAEGRFAAAAFTSQIQARNLFAIAERIGQKAALATALRSRTVVAAVGPTCARALCDLGVAPQVVPAAPKMGPMVSALAAHLLRERA